MSGELLRAQIKSLVSKFEANKYHYLSKKYLEEEVKIDFINPLFENLGWDVRNKKSLSPFEREVVVEKGETLGRPDYNFRIDGQTKFYMEVKAPHEPLHKIDHVLQAKSYAWNTKSVFIVLLTDFEEFRLFDATIKPDPKYPDQGLLFELTYDQYLNNLDKLLILSKNQVEQGSLDDLIQKHRVPKSLRKPVDESFLEDISRWREELAKDIYKRNYRELEDEIDEGKIRIQVKILNEAVQKILDRLIFIRIAEDRKIIEPKSLLDEVEWWKAGGKRRNLHKRLTDRFLGWNQDFNGEILKPGPCDVLEIDSNLLAKIIEGLYFPKCPYLFEVIGVELLGSIYERYLGKTIKVTPKRVKIEEKPEVRKAGGVFYTPQYIVDYIVKNTVGKIIRGKNPKQIEKIKILDPACGSGSFLLTAYKTLIDYHLEYYEKHPEKTEQGLLFQDVITDFSGTKRLSIEKKANILRNNIFGVDIDPQAVEIAMMGLYLKCLEKEKDLPRKKELLPSLARNIRCGNSLISYDIYDQKALFDNEEKDRINPFDWKSKTTGFGQIMEEGGFSIVIGNPPYGAFLSKKELDYLSERYPNSYGNPDSFFFFIEKGLKLCKKSGFLGMIIPNTWTLIFSGKNFRRFLISNFSIKEIVHFKYKVFARATVDCEILITKKELPQKNIINVKIESVEKTKENKIKQKNWIAKDGDIVSIFSTNQDEKILTKINLYSKKMSHFCTVKNGIKPFEVGKGNPPQTKEILRNKPYVSETKIDNTFVPLLRGGLINRYENKWKENYWVSYGPWLAAPRDSKIFFNIKEKIIIRQTADRIIGTLIDNSFVCRNNIHILLPKEDLEVDLKYILGILNSSLYVYYYNLLNPEKGEAFAEVKAAHIERLPVRTIDFKNNKLKQLYNHIVNLAAKILELNIKKNEILAGSIRDKLEREIQITDEKIDELVYEVYGITKDERKTIEKSIESS